MAYIPANRWQAFGVHIAVSLLLFILLASVIYFFWYPGFLFWFDGGLEGIKLIAGVDFLIGPLLTLCVYKLGKKGMKFDLVVIALLQAICLAGGMWTVWLTRPVAVVYSLGQFRTISYEVYKDYGIVTEQVPILNARWPVWVAVDVPQQDKIEIKETEFNFFYENQLYFRADYYVPFESYADRIRQDGKNPAAVSAKNPDFESVIAAYPASSIFYRLACGAGVGYLVMDEHNEILGTFTTATRKTAYQVLLEKLQVKLVELGYIQR